VDGALHAAIVDPAAPRRHPRSQADEQLVEIIHSYLT
jgi:hypothetical protein